MPLPCVGERFAAFVGGCAPQIMEGFSGIPRGELVVMV